MRYWWDIDVWDNLSWLRWLTGFSWAVLHPVMSTGAASSQLKWLRWLTRLAPIRCWLMARSSAGAWSQRALVLLPMAPPCGLRFLKKGVKKLHSIRKHPKGKHFKREEAEAASPKALARNSQNIASTAFYRSRRWQGEVQLECSNVLALSWKQIKLQMYSRL